MYLAQPNREISVCFFWWNRETTCCMDGEKNLSIVQLFRCKLSCSQTGWQNVVATEYVGPAVFSYLLYYYNFHIWLLDSILGSSSRSRNNVWTCSNENVVIGCQLIIINVWNHADQTGQLILLWIRISICNPLCIAIECIYQHGQHEPTIVCISSLLAYMKFYLTFISVFFLLK